MKGFKPWSALLAMLFITSAHADKLDDARAVENKINREAATSQKNINASADNTLSMKAEIEQLQEEVKNLTVYRDHLARLVANQEQESGSLSMQIDGIKQTRQGLVPLMYGMIDGLKQSVSQDKPIRLAQRLERVEKLENMMSQADISDAEKYRRILESYQIELDYGIKLGTYSAVLTSSDSTELEADMLYLGRLSLVARSLDGKRYWVWKDNTKQWQELDKSFGSDIDKAYAIANKQIAPSLLTLPLSVMTEGK